VKANRGAAGVDRETLAAVEQYGVERMLDELHAALQAGTYRPPPVLRRYIPKPDGRQRPLGIPTAATIVLEPIFEADFRASSYGFRPKRSATQALATLRVHGARGGNQVLDADIRDYLDRTSHYTPADRWPSKRRESAGGTLMRKPLRRPRHTWTASSSPRLTRCNTVCRETPSRRVASIIGTNPSGAVSTKRARSSAVNRMRHGAPGVSCSPAMKPSLIQR
jgi:hypothetical protein